MNIKFIRIGYSRREGKKYYAEFFDADRKLVKTNHFGSDVGVTYNMHKDDKVKRAWLARHSVRGTFDDPTSPSALSRYLLWNKKTMTASFKDYLSKFNLKEY